ncbi:hypothetical protein ABGN05_09095 [Aquibium sp. LZ166]|uniref:Aminoglycoside phosphotransferase domain-containing protein n=1 Tax=Aquibium pacificus TaxID=3153579 RepID=A0ABV3SJM0_9HYPH
MASLAEKVRFLSDPAAYSGTEGVVRAHETHMSWVFIGERSVYKLKKPVRYPFLDFGTPAKRKFFCEEELRLNRRLAAETYRAVIPLCQGSAGSLSIGGEGKAVDWLVVMERLPEAEMLDEKIRHGRFGEDDVARIGETLARFYRARRPEPDDGRLYLEHLRREHVLNRTILSRRDLGLDEAAAALEAVGSALELLSPTIEDRIRRGLIVEGHGDLRPEHVCLVEPVQIIDCLEFNRAMRLIDPYDEVGYLGLECDVLGAAWVRPMLLDILEKRHGGRPGPQLLAFHGAFRALLRARLCMAHLLETPVRHPLKWKPLALRYIAAAQRDCLNLPSREGPTAARPSPGA